KSRRERQYRILQQAGAENGLSFTSQEKIAGGLMGFDNLGKVLLVLQFDGKRPSWHTIHLASVSACTVFTAYSVQPTAVTNLYSLGESVEEVVLQFEFTDGRPPAAIPFYHVRHHPVAALPELEHKVRSWQQFLSKLLEQEHLDRA
ncbi:MAG TPA: hypothetical protein VGE66_19490, partial [Chitinophagaceae bacterium]